MSIRLLIIEDSAGERELLPSLLSADSEIDVVGAAPDKPPLGASCSINASLFVRAILAGRERSFEILPQLLPPLRQPRRMDLVTPSDRRDRGSRLDLSYRTQLELR